ncbi:Receptor-like serine/threonine-protein kinase [Melia azedarach]|uniref:Receptor-like serine/threonine-protein kinase n=1 Tax=Melia azedarach TaxID=155640 RepID=A0ACC1Y4G1_MELAZ|nr:Receptor-like serine/threonine-protein kinase [Melia azedarach]
MDSFPFFIIIVAIASVVYLIVAITVVGSKKYNLVLSTALAIVAAVGLIIYCVGRKPRNKGEDLMRFDLELSLNAGNTGLIERDKCGRGRKKEVELPLFSFSSVSAATNNFSDTNKLGEGGFGPVYKGVLLKGDEIAVKRLSGTSGQGLEELKNEATVIAKVQHKNLVRLLGCCIDKEEKILIYEYMPNKSLDFLLFDQVKRILLDWETRTRIIEGVAQGLLYLHQHSRLRIIHRDLKSSNILLDKDMNPKISDFGVARIIFGGNELQAKTNRIVGTYGYIAPEYALRGVFSTKSDVFSFGVVLLEILSSRKNAEFYQAASLNLLDYAWDLWTSDKVLDLIDPVILEDASSMHTILPRYVNIALLCVQERAEDRPTMSDVVSMLTNEAAPLLPPKQPAFSHLRDPAMCSTSRSESCSINKVTISILQAR